MSREVRRVPPDWQHPRDKQGHYVPLYDGAGYDGKVSAFMARANCVGLQSALDYYGSAPDCEGYMPRWSPDVATHYMMYETCTEGTPISPAFATPEELARWLADTGASVFADATATYDQWMSAIVEEAWTGFCVLSDGSVTAVVAP